MLNDVRRPSWGLAIWILAIWILALSLIVLVTQAPAQQRAIRHYTNRDGLPQRQVMAVHQDKSGYIWAGTLAGLSRFNGTTFTNFTTEDGLPSNVVTGITEDHEGRLLVLTQQGVCIRRVDGFQVLKAPEHLIDSRAEDVLVSHSGDLWVATQGGLTWIHEGKSRHFGMADGLPSDRCLRVGQGEDGTIHVATSQGFASLIDSRFQIVSPEVSTKNAMRILNAGKWGVVLVTASGVHILEDGRLIPLPIHSDLSDTLLYDAAVDGRERLWVTSQRGAIRCDGDSFERLTTDQGLATDVLYHVFIDREDTVWFGTESGLSKFVSSPFCVFGEKDGLPHPFVRSINEDSEGRVWIGTREGVVYRGENTFVHVSEPADIRDTRVYALEPGDDGAMLLGTWSGLYVWKDGRVERCFRDIDGLPDDLVYCICPYPEGGYLLGTRQGLAHFVHDKIEPSPFDSSPAVGMIAMAYDHSGRLWIGCLDGVRVVEGGLIRYLGANEGLTDQTAWAVSIDLRGRIWIGSNGDGLFCVDGESISRVNVSDGLADNFVWQILCDSAERVWAFTSQGLNCIDGDQFSLYDQDDGLVDIEGSVAASLEDSRGRLWFGTGSGVHFLEPNAEFPEPFAPMVVIESVELGNDPIEFGATLDPLNDILTFHCAVLSYRGERGFSYEYRLEGLSGEWTKSRESAVSFAELPAGHYRFLVRGGDEDADSLGRNSTWEFVIRTPILENGWFRAFAVLGFFLIVLAMLNRRSRKLAADRSRLESLVAERTLELQTNNERLQHEIDERRESERKRKNLEEALGHAQKMDALGRLAGGVAHDFNNSLTTILGMSDLLGQELGIKHPLYPDVHQIIEASELAASVTDQLLAFCRKQVIAPRRIELNESLQGMGRMLRRIIGEDVALDLTLYPSELHVKVDPGQLEQILMNLAANARDAMPLGGRLGIVSAHESLSETHAESWGVQVGSYAKLIVRDSGCGMSESVLARLFEPFFTTKPRGKGTGLGLSTVYGIVRQNGGAVFVESAPGDGAVFTILLPLTDLPATVGVAGDPLRRAESLDGLTVFVVEDDALVLNLVCAVLKKEGCHVLHARNGNEALNVSREVSGTIDICLTDVIMPGMSGPAFVSLFHQIQPNAVVVYMSGYAGDALQLHGISDSQVNFISKPFHPETLVDVLRVAWAHKGQSSPSRSKDWR